jgi:non-reducing end alpha-L-arabinofuranosidase
MYGGYTGPLYQVCKGAFTQGPNSCTSGMTMDIGSVGGFADSATQDAFCAGATCTISIIYDQSPNKNDLRPSPRGGNKPSPDNPAFAADLKTTISGHTVYGILINPNDARDPATNRGMGYRSGCSACATPTAKGTATGDQPETEYMVTSQNNLGAGAGGCCFDYGNAETTSNDDNNGTMEAVYFGQGVVWGTGSPGGHGNGPWVEADLENGLYAGWSTTTQDQNITTNTPLKFPFVTAVVVGDVTSKNGGMGRFALYGGDATASAPLKQLYDGIRPAKNGSYTPMRKEGSIILGTGGDNSDADAGQWFEGVMASGAATVATVNALQANIAAAGYGK